MAFTVGFLLFVCFKKEKLLASDYATYALPVHYWG